jgi:hypothetical protein
LCLPVNGGASCSKAVWTPGVCRPEVWIFSISGVELNVQYNFRVGGHSFTSENLNFAFKKPHPNTNSKLTCKQHSGAQRSHRQRRTLFVELRNERDRNCQAERGDSIEELAKPCSLSFLHVSSEPRKKCSGECFREEKEQNRKC